MFWLICAIWQPCTRAHSSLRKRKIYESKFDTGLRLRHILKTKTETKTKLKMADKINTNKIQRCPPDRFCTFFLTVNNVRNLICIITKIRETADLLRNCSLIALETSGVLLSLMNNCIIVFINWWKNCQKSILISFSANKNQAKMFRRDNSRERLNQIQCPINRTKN